MKVVQDCLVSFSLFSRICYIRSTKFIREESRVSSGLLSKVNEIGVGLLLHMERLQHITCLSFNPILCVHDDIILMSLFV